MKADFEKKDEVLNAFEGAYAVGHLIYDFFGVASFKRQLRRFIV